MRVLVTNHSHKAMKRALAHEIPEVASRHRAEALARGLGWECGIALREALRRSICLRDVNDRAFVKYLGCHGYAVTSAPLHRVVAAFVEGVNGTAV